MPIVNSIASVYQTKRLKDAIKFHHAAFNNCAKSTLLTAASKRILPLWPLLTRSNISKYVTEILVKHWRDTKWGAPFQCSPESDLNFHVEPNEFHMTVCLARPRLPREL